MILPVPLRSFVVDASVALKWYVEEEDSELAARLTDADAVVLYAPAHWPAEMANALWARARSRTEPLLPPAETVRALDSIARGGVRLHELGPVLEPAWRIAVDCDVTMYDALYVATAERLDLPFVTADARLVGRLRGTAWGERAVALSELPELD